MRSGNELDDSVACKSFLTDIISKTKSVEKGNGLGVFYWEPESYNNWQGYSLGAFDNSGKPTPGTRTLLKIKKRYSSEPLSEKRESNEVAERS